MGVAIATRRKEYITTGTRAWVSRISRKIRIPIAMYPCKVEERLTIELVEGKKLTDKEKEIERMMIYWEQVEYDVSDDDDSTLKSTAWSVPKDYELGDTGDDTFWFGSKTVGMDEFSWFVWFARVPVVFVFKKINIFVLESLRVDGRSYLQSGAIDGSEANGIIRDPKQEVWNECRSYKVRVGSNGNLLWEVSVLLGCHQWRVHGDDVAKTVFRMRNRHVEVYGYAFWVNQCTSGFHGVNEPVARKDDRGVTEGREDVREVFQQRGSRAKRKLSRCGRDQMGNEPILALLEGADDFVVYYDARRLLLQPELAEYKWGRITKDIVVKLPSVTVLWAITRGSELNGLNLIQETTNKIVVIQERLEAAKLSKELAW
ncbi:hypothetical protein Tco_1540940 [Tanacetum coccineum]